MRRRSAKARRNRRRCGLGRLRDCAEIIHAITTARARRYDMAQSAIAVGSAVELSARGPMHARRGAPRPHVVFSPNPSPSPMPSPGGCRIGPLISRGAQPARARSAHTPASQAAAALRHRRSSHLRRMAWVRVRYALGRSRERQQSKGTLRGSRHAALLAAAATHRELLRPLACRLGVARAAWRKRRRAVSACWKRAPFQTDALFFRSAHRSVL